MKKIILKSAPFLLVGLFGAALGYLAHQNITYKNRYSKENQTKINTTLKKKKISKKREVKGIFIAKGTCWNWRRDYKKESNKDMDKLLSLPYIQGSKAPAKKRGVTIYHPDNCVNGYNLYSSTHAPEAFLMDMKGRVLHKWFKSRDDIWPYIKNDTHLARRYFRRLHLYENGDILAIYEYTGIIKLDANSKLIWARQSWNHHDMFIDKRGKIYALAQEKVRDPKVFNNEFFFDNIIEILNPKGELIDRISIFDSFLNSNYSSLFNFSRLGGINFVMHGVRDPFHTNTIDVFDGSQAHISSLFKKGNILISMRNLCTIAIIDSVTKHIIWTAGGMWFFQHQPLLLDNKRMLIFDNNPGIEPLTNKSRILEFDPFSKQIYWEYTGSKQNPFYSSLQGSVQRLANGSTLITESDYGRVFEVNREKEIVWEFKSPHTTGKNNEFVAIIPELIRISPKFPIKNFVRVGKKGT